MDIISIAQVFNFFQGLKHTNCHITAQPLLLAPILSLYPHIPSLSPATSCSPAVEMGQQPAEDKGFTGGLLALCKGTYQSSGFIQFLLPRAWSLTMAHSGIRMLFPSVCPLHCWVFNSTSHSSSCTHCHGCSCMCVDAGVPGQKKSPSH